MNTKILLSAASALDLDREARENWGLNEFALVEAAGRSCGECLVRACPELWRDSIPKVVAMVGPGNNGADAMVMLRYLLLTGRALPENSAVVINRIPSKKDLNPRSESFRVLKMMKLPILVWDGDLGEAFGRPSEDILAHADLVIDGISGTGLKGSLEGKPIEMVNALNAQRILKPPRRIGTPFKRRRPFVVSLDVPSGNSDSWLAGMPIVEADATLAIEPQKSCLYNPAARPYGGTILPVEGIFPQELIRNYGGIELIDWDMIKHRIPRINPDAYKYERGTVEIHAGSPGSTGAAGIAARGAQAAGAGMVLLMADEDIYPVLASRIGGVMVIPAGKEPAAGRLPDALLMGPGWGRDPKRAAALERALELEKAGIPLVLDADGIYLARDRVFHGNAILTPHPGEFSVYAGIPVDQALTHPKELLIKLAREKKAVIVLKSHVIIVAAPDGRIGVLDGMSPGLAAGGTGDLLAGFCAAIMGRLKSMNKRSGSDFDGYIAALTAAALLIAVGKSGEITSRFTDPMELADRAADLAGQAWLSSGRDMGL
ncbi:MAG: bifunctional ADP-dependent NAD(P)H-hydrate dehydratase/NAD(P)H-hydrate epimerase [Treponema sp.]|jgi:NAD(P)H-hydrate epimerase|nr:bifunctional ADP-dependent NAD(P)H-hydrate dehydratase/NAD(P)H-hydrate epimerase [Treponema sp.]